MSKPYKCHITQSDTPGLHAAVVDAEGHTVTPPIPATTAALIVTALNAYDPTPVERPTPRVLVHVNGGVADHVADEGVEVIIFDRDNYNDDPANTDKVPAAWADLAKFFGAPVESKQRFLIVAWPEDHDEDIEQAATDIQEVLDGAQVGGARVVGPFPPELAQRVEKIVGAVVKDVL